MNRSKVNQVSLREALRTAARWLALLGLSAGAVVIGRGRVRAGCEGTSPCNGCGELSRCGLPRAVAARNRTFPHGVIAP